MYKSYLNLFLLKSISVLNVSFFRKCTQNYSFQAFFKDQFLNDFGSLEELLYLVGIHVFRSLLFMHRGLWLIELWFHLWGWRFRLGVVFSFHEKYLKFLIVLSRFKPLRLLIFLRLINLHIQKARKFAIYTGFMLLATCIRSFSWMIVFATILIGVFSFCIISVCVV